MKLDNETIVHRYGKALFELAEEMKIRNKFHSELQEYKKVLQNEPQLKVFMSCLLYTSPSPRDTR